jgi:hypothetical protein
MRMRSKLMTGGLMAAAFCLTTPVWARDGHDNWRHDRHDRRVTHDRYDRHDRHWNHRPIRERVVVREYVNQVPVYPQMAYPAYQSPAPGIHVVIPDLYFPFP